MNQGTCSLPSVKKVVFFLIFFSAFPGGFLFAEEEASDVSLVDGLVSYWPLDEEGGERKDVVSSNNLSDNNTVSSATGHQGIAADFEGSDMGTLAISESTQNGLDIIGDLSFSIWIKPESFSTGDGQILLAKWQHGLNNQYHLHLTDSQLAIIIDNDCSGYTHVGRTWNHNMSEGNWYHIVVVYRALSGSAEAFVNNISIGTVIGLPNSIANCSANFVLGMRDDSLPSSYYFDGLMDEVGLWNRALTADEVSKLYNDGKGLPYEAFVDLPVETGLDFPDEAGYDGVRGVNSGGPNPEKGLAGEDVFTFKVVYTHLGNVAPETVDVQLGGIKTLLMQVDTEAETFLQDGSFTNGEQYVVATTLEKGSMQYWFSVEVDNESFILGEDANQETLICTAGYSSVAFLPGLQSSRLFEKVEGDWLEDQLWEPNWNTDAEALAMTSDGTSLNADVYTKVGPEGALDEVLGAGGNIYKSFLEDLSEWKNDEHLIADYGVLAYDWRLAFDDVLSGGKVEGDKLYFDTSHTVDAPHIYSELRRLADGSDSGRVALVGHSMGGLIIKKLLADMEDDPSHPYRDLLEKVDVVILVASPQLGTPKAVGSLLHGMGQNFEPLAKKETLRRIAHDMPGAYTLVPSPEYFERVYDIDENGNALDHTLLVTGRGEDVTDYEGMREFLSDEFGVADDDLTIPMNPREDFLDDVNMLHERLDGWVAPDMDDDGNPDFSVVQIAGWGIQETIKGIEYVKAKRKVECEDGLTGTCYEEYIKPSPLFTADGDGTVVMPSAVAMGEESNEEEGLETWYVDMYAYNEDELLVNYSHASILEIDSARTIIKNTIENKMIDGKYIYKDKNELHTPEPYLRLAMHSPVDVSIQGAEGRVGLREDSTDEIVLSDADISNSYYFEFGEGKYLGVPLDGEKYDIVLQGTDDGVFTFELTEERNGIVQVTKTFRDIPVTKSTQAVLSISSLTGIDTLELDTNGDGIPDTLVYAEEYQGPASFSLLKKEIEKLDVKVKKQLLQTLTVAESFADRGKTSLVKQFLLLLENKVTLFSSDRRSGRVQIPENSAERIVEIIRELCRGL